MKRSVHRLDVAVSLALAAAVWLSRALFASTFVTWDEPAWVYRSAKFLDALLRGDWAGTMLVGHPGVTIMWSGTLSLAWHRWVTHVLPAATLAEVATWPALNVQDPAMLHTLGVLLPLAKGALPLWHAVLTVLLYALLRRLLDRRYAVAGSLLLAFDPYALGLARVLHLDALTAELMLVSVLAALLYSRTGARRSLLLSGAAGGLAALTKIYGILAVGLAGLGLALAHLAGWIGREGEARPIGWHRLLSALRDLAWLSGATLVSVFLAWPALWVAPLTTLRNLFDLSSQYAIAPQLTTNFFQGRVVEDAGALFYPVSVWLRTTPPVLIGSAFALLGLAFRQDEDARAPTRRAATWALLAYAVLYLALISVSKKKYDRYALPALLVLDLFAALGWVGALSWMARLIGWWDEAQPRTRRIAFAGLAAPLLAAQLLLLCPLAPVHYLAYYNPWAGGARRAFQTLPVGWGEGLEQAVAYLSARPDASELYVATLALPGVAPLFPGQVLPLDEKMLYAADYILLYAGDIQGQDPLARRFYGVQTPEFVARVNGIEYAWLYRNPSGAELGILVEQVAQPGDALLFNASSSFVRHYTGALRHAVLDGTTDAQVAEALRAVAQGARRILYVEYPGAPGRGREIIRRQLAQHTLFLWEKPFGEGTLACYQMLDGATFAPVAPAFQMTGTLDDQLALEHYGVSPSAEYRQAYGITLQWRVRKPLNKDYHLSLRLVDMQGQVWGQHDLPLEDDSGARSSAWAEGTLHTCNLTLSMEAGTPPGWYWIALGVYDLESLVRLDVLGQGDTAGAEFKLGPVEVRRASVPPTLAELPIRTVTDLPLGNKLQLLGYTLASERYTSGDTVTVTLFWRCLEEMEQPYRLSLRLRKGEQTIGVNRGSPAGRNYPTSLWAKGEVLRYTYVLHIAPEAASGSYGLYLDLHAPDGHSLTPQSVRLAELQVEHRERLFTPPPIRFPWQATLGDSIELLGYDLQETSLWPGGTLHLTLYWRALDEIEADYTVFAHLLDAQNQVRGQRDSQPVGGERPTSGWLEGEIIIDSYEIPVDADAPAGTYRLEVGMYDPADGERLPVTLANGATDPDRRALLDQTLPLAP